MFISSCHAICVSGVSVTPGQAGSARLGFGWVEHGDLEIWVDVGGRG